MSRLPADSFWDAIPARLPAAVPIQQGEKQGLLAVSIPYLGQPKAEAAVMSDNPADRVVAALFAVRMARAEAAKLEVLVEV